MIVPISLIILYLHSLTIIFALNPIFCQIRWKSNIWNELPTQDATERSNKSADQDQSIIISPPLLQGGNMIKINSYQAAMATRQSVKWSDLFVLLFTYKNIEETEGHKQSLDITDISAL
jgi:hypothetical protein